LFDDTVFQLLDWVLNGLTRYLVTHSTGVGMSTTELNTTVDAFQTGSIFPGHCGRPMLKCSSRGAGIPIGTLIHLPVNCCLLNRVWKEGRVLIPHSRPFSQESRIRTFFHQFPESHFSFPEKYN